MGSFFVELKRRHIYQVAAVYTVVAWLLLQVVNNVAPVLDLPPWIARAVLLLLLIGFPLALVFAWIHQLAPTATSGGALQSASGSAGRGALLDRFNASTELPSRDMCNGARPAAISIAVLPLTNLSGDPAQEFFSDGMTEEITTALAKVPDLRVVARTSAFQFKSQHRDIKIIGDALHVTHLIEGSVRKEGNQVRITAQLIKSDDGTHIWAESYNRQLTGVFAIQEDIAHAIAGALRVSLGLKQGEALVSNRTGDTSSYQDYLRAKWLFRQRLFKEITDAKTLLEKVVARDPNYAPAWALLAQAYSVMPHFHSAWISDSRVELRQMVDSALPRAEEAAQRAIRLDPKSAGGYAALGFVHELRGRLLSAEELYANALELDRDEPFTLHHYSLLLGAVGRLKEALSMRQRLLTLDPLVPVFKTETANLLWVNGQNEAAIGMLKELPAAYVIGAARLSKIYASMRRYEEAAATLAAIPSGFFPPGILDEARRLLRTAPTPVAAPESLPRLGILEFVYGHIGAPRRAFEWFENGVEDGFSVTPAIASLWHSDYAPIRRMQRFKPYLHNTGLIEYWRARGWPEFCRPTASDDFECD